MTATVVRLYTYSVQLLSRVRLSATPGTTTRQTSLSITNSQSLLKLMSIESVMLSNHLILCCPLFFLPSILPSIRVSSDKWTLHIRWPKHWSFSFSISPSSKYSGFISFRIDWFGLEWRPLKYEAQVGGSSCSGLRDRHWESLCN